MLLERLIVKLEANIDEFKSNLTAADRAMDQFGGRLQSIGKGLTAGVTLPLVAAGGAAVKFAADAEEAGNKFDVVFGSAASSVRQEIDSLRESIPAARHELIGMAAGIQDLLVPLGIAAPQAATMSVEVLKLAGDLASFNNLSVADVLRDIQSGFVGSSEPLLKYGADVRQAAVETKALELGLIAEGEALTNAARAQAVLAIVTESNVAALGDAANTANSAANSMKFLVADSKDLAVTFGQILLPVITPMVQGLSSAAKAVAGLSPEVQKSIVVVAGLAAATGPLLIGVGTLIKLLPVLKVGFAALTGPIGLTVAAITAAATVWAIWGDDIKRIVGETVTAVREWFSNRLTSIFDSVQRKIDAVTGAFRSMYDKVVGNSYVPDMVDGIAAQFARLDAVMVQPTLAGVAKINAAFASVQAPSIITSPGGMPTGGGVSYDTGAAAQALAALGLAAQEARYRLGYLGRSALDLFSSFTPLGLVTEILGSALNRLAPIVAEILSPLSVIGSLVATVLTPVLRLLAPPLRAVAIGATYIVEAFGWLIEALGHFVDSIVPDWISKAGKGLDRAGQEMQDGAKAAREELQGKLAPAVEDLVPAMTTATEAVQSFARQLTNVPDIFDYARRLGQSVVPSSSPPAIPGVTGPTDQGGGIPVDRPLLSVNVYNPPAGMDPRAVENQIAHALTTSPRVQHEVRKLAALTGRRSAVVPA